MSIPWFWLSMMLLCLCAEALFTMSEIAIISFNKVRLLYYVNKKIKRAIWIHNLLQKPEQLFGSVLLGVGIALQLGSECSRQFFLAVGLAPNLALPTQFLLVVLFAELSPLFAGRRYAEHVCMLFSPIIYAVSKLFFPIVFFFGLSVKFIDKLFRSQEKEKGGFLSREELQKAVEEHDDMISHTQDTEEFNAVVANIFLLRSKTASEVMLPLDALKMVSSTCTVEEMRLFVKEVNHSRIPCYHRSRDNIVGIAEVRRLVRSDAKTKVRELTVAPWFITKDEQIVRILEGFRKNSQETAIVLDGTGRAIGMLTLEDILDEIFHKEIFRTPPLQAVIERHFLGTMQLKDFNKTFHASLNLQEAATLEELILKRLEHHPEIGDSIRIDQFEITVEDCSFRSIKSVSVKTIV